jgi:tetratricopeptide (TPR) repeat protein
MNYRRPVSFVVTFVLMMISTHAQTTVAQDGVKIARDVPSLIEIPTANSEAYVEYSRGLELRDAQRVSVASANYDSDGISEHFLRATELDPDFLDAWLMIVQFSSGAVWFNRDPDGKHLQHVQEALARIQALAPDSPEMDLANGFYEYYVTRDITAAFTAFERAAAGRPNDLQALEYLSASARRLQHWDTSASAMDRLVLLDPDNQRARRQQINNLQDSTDYDATIEAAAAAIQKFPDDVWFRVRHATLVARHTGDVTLCRRLKDDVSSRELFENGFLWSSLLRGVFADPEQAVAWIESADPDSRSHETAPQNVNYVVGYLQMVGGNAEAALLRLKAAYAQFSARMEGANEEFRGSQLGRLSYYAALAGEKEAALEYRELALTFAAATDDILYGNMARNGAAHSLATLGEVDEAWLELEPLIGEPRGPTEWDPILSYDTAHIFADSKGYQARVAQLEKIEPMERLPTQKLVALEAYNRGMEKQQERTASSLEEAVDYFEEAIALDPGFAKAHALLGQVLILQNTFAGLPLDLQIAKAEPHILRALELDDTWSEVYVALGYMKRRQGDFEGSKSAYKKAIELDPNNAYVYATFATLLNSYLGEASEGARMIRKSYDLDPNSKSSLDRLARSFEWSGELDRAQELRESTAAKNPEDARAQRNLGAFYLWYQGRFDDAIVAYRKALFLDPKGTHAPRNISDAYLLLGDREQAVSWGNRMLKMLERGSSSEAARRAWILKIEGDDAAREEQALLGLRENPQSGSLLRHMTDLDIASGQPERSRSRWELAYPSLFAPSIEFHGRNVWQAKDLARVLMATGEREQANYLTTGALATSRSMAPTLYAMRLQSVLYAIAGDEKQALTAIGRFLEAGGSPYDLMMQDALKPFQDNPKYQEMAAKREIELAVQLKRIREMEAGGELAPIPVLPAD